MRTLLWTTAAALLALASGCGPSGNQDGKDTGPSIAFNKSGPGPMKGPGDISGTKAPKGLNDK